ncbi:MAG: YqaA family protein [Patescibacteria group bacterium UBA2103]
MSNIIEEVDEKAMPWWWKWFQNHGDSFLARFLLALFAILDSIIIFFPPEIAISALVLARPKKWIFYTLYTTFFTIVGAIITYILGAYFFETFGSALLGVVGGAETFADAKALFNQNALWGIIFVGVTPIPWVPFLLAAGVFKINFFIFLAGVVIARLMRFGIIAFIVAHLGPRGLNMVFRTLQTMGTIGVALSIFATIILSSLFVHFLL